VDVEPSELLSNSVREKLQRWACVVRGDGVSVKGYTTLVVMLRDAKVTTIEGLIGDDNELHPMQQAFHDNHGLQCGFCTPGIIMSAIEFAHQHPDSAEAQARTWLMGNICYRTGYQNIIAPVLAGCVAMQHQRRPQL
jgi:carbon-monoxide dehydrogenase small subunit